MNKEKTKLISFVWNNFDSDDRVKKKIDTLSKKFDSIIVYCVPKPKDYKRPIKKINNKITVRYINTKHIYNWIAQRLIFNELFWTKQIIPEDLEADILVIDCNDPDTLFAGKYIIEHYNQGYKLIYDSHEYHNDNYVPYPGLLGYYSRLASYLHKKREQKYIYPVNKMIVVSNGIKYLIEKDNLTSVPINVIPNYSKKYESEIKNKKRIATFVGGHSRPGLEKVIPLLQELNYGIYHIGNPPKNKLKGVTYLGHLTKDNFMKHLEDSEIGILYYDAPNKSFINSIPNKLSDYTQTNNLILTSSKLKEIVKIVKYYKIGFNILAEWDDNEREFIKKTIKQQIFKLKESNLNKKFQIAKEKLCWETNEGKLLDIYLK